MIKHSDRRLIEFESMTELARFCREIRASKSPTGRGNHMNGLYSSDGWYGPDAAGVLIEKTEKGDTNGVAAAQSMLNSIQTEISTQHYFDEPTVAGCYPVVPEALMGEPECMRIPTQVDNESAPVTVMVELTLGSDIDGKQCQSRGAAALALAMALSARRPITLKVGVFMGFREDENTSRNFGIVVNIDSAPLDLAHAAHAITNVGFTRRLMYSVGRWFYDWEGQWPATPGCQPQATFHPIHIAEARRIYGLSESDVFLPGIPNMQVIPRAAKEMIETPVKWVNDMLAKYTLA